jgi:hypothetical protein
MHNPLNLRESEHGWEQASHDILAILKIAQREYEENKKDANEAYKEVKAVLRKYQPWGACDTEPAWYCARTFCRGFPELNSADFYLISPD